MDNIKHNRISALLTLYTDSSEKVRAGVAAALKGDSPRIIFEALAADESQSVRSALASNPFVPREILKVLSKEEIRQVRRDASRTLKFLDEVQVAELTDLRRQAENYGRRKSPKVTLFIASSLTTASACIAGIMTYLYLETPAMVLKNGVQYDRHLPEIAMGSFGGLGMATGALILAIGISQARALRGEAEAGKEFQAKLREWNKETETLDKESERLSKEIMRRLHSSNPTQLDTELDALQRKSKEIHEELMRRYGVSISSWERMRDTD